MSDGSNLLLVGLSIVLAIGGLSIVISICSNSICETMKGLPGWKEYKEPEPGKIETDNLSAHLPKR